MKHPLALFFLGAWCSGAVPATCPEISSDAVRDQGARLRAELRFHDERYYQEQRPVISDAQYDRLFTELATLESCFPSLADPATPTQTVGAAPDARMGLRRHPKPMLSLASSMDSGPVEQLIARVRPLADGHRVFLVQPKVDGLPIELIYRDGELVSAATRGDGQMGEDVTNNVRKIPGMPLRLSGKVQGMVVVRGEVYAERALFARINRARGMAGNKPYATPRHFASSALRTRDPEPSALKALRLFPFEWVNADEVNDAPSTDRACLHRLAAWGFPVIAEHTQTVENLAQMTAAYQHYLHTRDRQPFAMDGIVIKVDDLALRKKLGVGSRAPHWAAAWKFPPATARTVVEEIVINTGRTGRQTPVARVRPVEIAGVHVSRVSLHSVKELARWGLDAGDEILIGLAGDVIPEVYEVFDHTPGTHGPLEPTALSAHACLHYSPNCHEQFVARVQHFASRTGLHIRGLGKSRIERLVDAGLVHDLPSLFELQAKAVADVASFGERSAEKLVAAIQSVRQPPLARFLVALGIPGVGPTTAGQIAYRFRSLEAIATTDEETLLALTGIGAITAQRIRAYFASESVRAMLKRFRGVGVQPVEPKTASPLSAAGSFVPAWDHRANGLRIYANPSQPHLGLTQYPTIG